ncbi:MAG: C39 family peptidase [Bryobacterales bacterium]|nr:C39 family peptidase [Bryobacterales bacterium]MBV9398268.1 C39 family peptidase [Bryobacterales bacterium]
MSEFTVQQQEKNQWCWAAVAVSLKDYLTAGKGSSSQCALAMELLKVDGCCSDNLACDQQEGLKAALIQLQVMNSDVALIPHPLTFQEIRQVVDAGWPIPVRIEWEGNPGNAHFVVLSGYRASAIPQVRVEDPFYGTSIVDYGIFVDGYRDSGIWRQTYPIWKGK